MAQIKPPMSVQARAAYLAQNATLLELKKADESITEALEVLKPDTRASIPEQVFVTYYLPYFSGTMPEEVAKNEKIIHDLVTHWVAVAGGPHMEMDVVGENGEVLFTVPALYHTDVLKTINLTGRGLIDTAVEYNQRRQQSPIAAKIWWTGALSARAEQILPKGWTSPETAVYHDNPRWQEIFSRYKIAPPKGVAAAAGAVTDGTEDLLYD